MRAEIAHYRANLQTGRDAAGVAALRRECAAIVARELGREEDVLDALVASIVFTPYPDVPPALERWRAAGLRLVVVSNWDVSLHEALERTGLAALVDGAVSSAEAGAAKPDPRIFARALEIAGVAAASAVHVGDEPEADVAGARAAGIEAVLLDRDSRGHPGVRTATSLADLALP